MPNSHESEHEQDFLDSTDERLQAMLDGFAAQNESDRGCCRIEFNGRVRERNNLTRRQCERAADGVGGKMIWRPGQDC